MKEEIKAFFKSEKTKTAAKKVFNKKTITGAIIILVLAAALRIGFGLMFQVEGIVSQVNGSKITVSNFYSTQTVDIGSFQSITSIQVGDRVEILKNLSGYVIGVRDRDGSQKQLGNRGYNLKDQGQDGQKFQRGGRR